MGAALSVRGQGRWRGGKKEISTGNYSNRLENIRTLWHETVGLRQGSLYPAVPGLDLLAIVSNWCKEEEWAGDTNRNTFRRSGARDRV